MNQKIVFSNGNGGVGVVHIADGDLSLAEHIAISVPVKVLKDGFVVQGVGEPYQAKVGDILDPRLAAMNNLSFAQVEYQIVAEGDLPADRLFRAAWALGEGAVVEDTDAAKQVAHELRRQARAAEFAPLDQQVVIAAANPEALAAVEAERQLVRDKYAEAQTAIDVCDCPDTLREVLAANAVI